jgi:hypothetical protein
MVVSFLNQVGPMYVTASTADCVTALSTPIFETTIDSTLVSSKSIVYVSTDIYKSSKLSIR